MNIGQNAELQAIREGSERFGKATLEETRQLFDHIAAQADEIVALRGILKQMRPWIMGNEENK